MHDFSENRTGSRAPGVETVAEKQEAAQLIIRMRNYGMHSSNDRKPHDGSKNGG